MPEMASLLGTLVLGIAALLVLLPAIVLAMQVVAGTRGGGMHGGGASRADDIDASRAAASRPRLTVLVPAHDEAAGIAATIAGIRAQLAGGDRLLVVADNCSDDTADLARGAGAEVVERRDTSRRGKGYALDHGVRHLERSAVDEAPQVVVIVDADCTLGPRALERLARRCAAESRPMQALYLMRAPEPATRRTRLAEFAWRVKNHLRPLGAARLGAPCPLMGTGMAFPWPLLRAAPLATGHLVEDMQLGVDLALAGAAPRFCPEAQVFSRFASSAAGLASQRRRWEHGHLGVIVAEVPRLLARAISRRSPTLLAMALDLAVPPLAALLLATLGVSLAALVFALAGGGGLPLGIASIALALIALAVGLAWSRAGRDLVSLGELARAPLWALGKLPLYLGFLRRRQTQWVRTQRDEPNR